MSWSSCETRKIHNVWTVVCTNYLGSTAFPGHRHPSAGARCLHAHSHNPYQVFHEYHWQHTSAGWQTSGFSLQYFLYALGMNSSESQTRSSRKAMLAALPEAGGRLGPTDLVVCNCFQHFKIQQNPFWHVLCVFSKTGEASSNVKN